MKMFLKVVLWFLLMVFRFALIIIGAVFAVPLGLVGDGKNRTPKMWQFWGRSQDIPDWYYRDKGSTSRWVQYQWMALRNPTQGFQKWFSQPVPELQPNPDRLVRSDGHDKAVRFMEHGIYWEWWRLSKINKGPWKGRYFEIRIGWKFVDERDGRDTFSPTIQFGPKR